MPGEFLHNLCRYFTICKEADIAISQTVEANIIAVFIYQINFSRRQILPDKPCRIDTPVKRHKYPVVISGLYTAF